jgi:hypothetical protein
MNLDWDSTVGSFKRAAGTHVQGDPKGSEHWLRGMEVAELSGGAVTRGSSGRSRADGQRVTGSLLLMLHKT